MLLQFNPVLYVHDHFEVPQDLTSWDPASYRETSTGWTPLRDRASFNSWGESLLPLTTEATSLENWYGIYLVAFDVPAPTLYVGIASNDVRSCEGALNRIKKHRVKTTGSHVGANPTGIGGVHHPKKWRYFAMARMTALGGPGDILKDARIIVSKFDGTDLQRKADLRKFESSIIANQNGILDDVAAKIWDGKNASQIQLLNGTKGKHLLAQEDQIRLW